MRKKTKLVLTVNQRRHIERELLRVTSVTKVARSSHVPPKLVKFVKQELIKKKKLTGNEIRQSVKKKTNAFQKESVKSTPIKTVEKQKDLRQKQSDDTAKISSNRARKKQNLERSISNVSGKRNTNRQELKISTKAQVERLKYKYKRQKLKTYRNKLKLDLNKIDMFEKEVNLERRKVELERKEVDLERREVIIERKNLELIMKEQKIKQTGERPEINEQRQKRMYLDSSYIHKQKLLQDKDSGGVEAETYMSITDLKKRGYEFMSNKKILHERTESAIRSRQD
ncbi:hypothetical protein [Enterococcus durans]|uniref:Uncharacterized protein n=2 Tax=Enterococcus durans TaxID=53345 RepID=A0A377L8B6_9ENTE|nr:hypothetical protein [Enterococcus durans]EOT29785.1 hypothetical protein OMS_02494 [Enterococcus durans ATCC 6056]EOU22619.1 hypothetical protein I571_01190 [Enterococcus durans ATCC 6056]MDB1686238.1 hypothetical protein [Enterococcus durans]PEH45650.1 hypothetical protein CRM96_11840 [Enterococcus durans]QPQ26826.1 hypothetical protein I4Q39_11550 [Enterococcus durans]